MKQIELFIEEFEKVLLKTLEDNSISLSQHKKTMKLLIQLQMNEDPFWYLLTKRQQSYKLSLENAALPPISSLQLSLTATISSISTDIGRMGCLNQVKRTCSTFSSIIPEFYNLCIQYNEEIDKILSKSLKSSKNNTNDPFKLLEELINHFILLLNEVLLEKVEKQKKSSKKQSKNIKTSKKFIEKIKSDIIEPQKCLSTILFCSKSLRELNGLHDYLHDLFTFIDKIIEKVLQHSICDLIHKIKDLESVEWNDNLLTPEFLLSSVEDLIQETIIEWEEILSILEKVSF